MSPPLEGLLETALRAALAAGAAALEVYNAAEVGVSYKEDRSPLTLADRRAHAILEGVLRPTGLPVLSEEGREVPWDERRRWRRLWIVDPLDGTKEFIGRRGEFTVNVALVEEGRPRLGVVFLPVPDRLYFGLQGQGAFRIDAASRLAPRLAEPKAFASLGPLGRRLPLPRRRGPTWIIVGSRSHATPELEAFVEQRRRELGDVDFVPAGSALKYCLVAEGSADLYPRLGPTMEWDTAAGQAVVEAAGGLVVRHDTGEPLAYNKEDLRNPWHFAGNPEALGKVLRLGAATA
ncbi:MAG: 3'(2'),5'-bisphosphate nucleotidase CysQ [Desulfobacterales bacterium]